MSIKAKSPVMNKPGPIGTYKIAVCTSIYCLKRGSAELISHLEEKLCVRQGDETGNGKFTLRQSECMGCCSGAPSLHINNSEKYEFMTPGKIDSILASLR